jgi:hypothetical protein
MVTLTKQGVAIDVKESTGWIPEGSGVTFKFSEGPDLFISDEMYERIKQTFEYVDARLKEAYPVKGQ